MKVILSGGGTGGHIYPAVSVAEALKERFGDQVEILFVGAEGKMEMELLPSVGVSCGGFPSRDCRDEWSGATCCCRTR